MHHTTGNPIDPTGLDAAHNALDVHSDPDPFNGLGSADGGLSVETLECLVELGKAAAYSPNTHRTYDVGYRNWTRWATGHGYQAFPAAPGHFQM